MQHNGPPIATVPNKILLCLCIVVLSSAPMQAQIANTLPIHVTGFFPAGYVTDGSVSYQAKANRGPEKGSKREDQGLVAMYYVHDFTVRGCRLEGSRSDGTHFYFCQRGQFNDNLVYRAKMGGYFLESCRHVVAADNIIRDNGSRGVTIERGSQFCTLNGNTITGSGREGLWIPDSLRCVITGNIFSLNGRKSNGEERSQIWNANITINQATHDRLHTPTAHYVIADNIIETDSHQIAAIRVDTRGETLNIVIQGNLMIGDNRRILVEGPDQQAVTIRQNHNAKIERVVSDELYK